MKRKTHEQFVKELKEKHPDYEPLSFYVNNRTKVKIKDTICGTVWYATPDSLLCGGHGCPTCGAKNKALHHTAILEEVLAEIELKYPNMFEYIKGYTKKSAKCWWRCKICGHVWRTTACRILSGTGCPECAKKRVAQSKLTPLEKLLAEIEEKYPGMFEYVGGYIDKNTKCWWKCKICNCIFQTTPYNLLKKHSCPNCRFKSLPQNNPTPLIEVLEDVKRVWGNLIVYVEGYTKKSANCKWKCTICGHEWYACPLNIIKGTGCPICIKKSMERPVIDLLKKNYIYFEHDIGLEGSNYNGSKSPLRIDFLIKTEKGILVIETDGQQHFNPTHGKKDLEEQQKRDRHKDKYCKEKGYLLIRATSSPTKKWGTDRHVTLPELFNLIELAKIPEKHTLNFDIFKPYDFNRE